MVLRVKESTEIVACVNPTFLLQKRLPGLQIPFSCPGDSCYSSDDSPSNSPSHGIGALTDFYLEACWQSSSSTFLRDWPVILESLQRDC